MAQISQTETVSLTTLKRQALREKKLSYVFTGHHYPWEHATLELGTPESVLLQVKRERK
jgi:hypothetical protein